MIPAASSPGAAKFTGQHAAGYWHRFYLRNEDRFYKDRHYFEAEFPQLLRAGTVLEVGPWGESVCWCGPAGVIGA